LYAELEKCVPIVVQVSLPAYWKTMIFPKIQEIETGLPCGGKVLICLNFDGDCWENIFIYNKNGEEIYKDDYFEPFVEELIECDVAVPIETSPAHFGVSKYHIKINWV